MTMNLFENPPAAELQKEALSDGAFLLRGFALANEAALLHAVRRVSTKSPFRHMVTPGGFRMSVAMTNCGSLGWVTDRSGYRYDPIDLETGRAWPALPESFLGLAQTAAVA